MMARPNECRETLQRVIYSTPIIDNHAHPLVKLASVHEYPLLAVATEAHGDASASSRSGLPHLRAVKCLARTLNCDESWDAVVQTIDKKRSSPDSYAEWTKQCFRGIDSVLVDDGLDGPEKTESYRFFNQFTRSQSKRIVRIEHLIPPLVEEALQLKRGEGFKILAKDFGIAIKEAIENPEVAGFKSVICYRTGLAISHEIDIDRAVSVFDKLWEERNIDKVTHEGDFKRLEHPGLNEFFVHLLASCIDESGPLKKPIQFHTGLGDNDITLTSASPSHLQQFIRRWPNVPIVLLHSGYPFVREMGYMATMYKNVYADIGEVFPFLSRGGQESVIRQMLELCPSSKILWSTDGHWFPETYLLAVEQMREVLVTVLTKFVSKGDLSCIQAVNLVKDVLFNNSNHLYHLGLQPTELPTNSAIASPVVQNQPNAAILRTLLSRQEAPRFLRVCWSDLTGTLRMKCVPVQRALSILESGEPFSLGIAHAAMGLLQNDFPAKGVIPTGETRLHPDYASLRMGPREGHVTSFGNFQEKDGSPGAFCPRTLLQDAVKRASQKDVSFRVGFEVELVFMKRSSSGIPPYEPLRTDGHAWCVSRAMEHEVAISVIEPALSALEAAGIHVESYHPESAPGQYEVILPATDPLRAVENLLFSRDVISNHATSQGYRMTLHPKPYPDAGGTAAHVHLSLSTPKDPQGADPKLHEPFYAGVLSHLRGIAAFTYSSMASYDRAIDFCWSGGTYIAWGTQNRETPLRKIEGSHWELKCMDGMANPYLAISAILFAGLDGIEKDRRLTWEDCAHVPASLSEEARRDLGIRNRFPADVSEAMEALAEDAELRTWMGEMLVLRYLSVKESETELLQGMGLIQRRNWVLERY